MSFSISIVIPNYNGKMLLQKNLPFVLNALTTSGINDYEIIISDDQSTDGSCEFIQEKYPDIKFITNTDVRGFSNNANNGMGQATKDLVLILNSDVELSDNYFTPLLPLFEKQDTFGVMSRITGIDNDKIQDGAKYPQYSFGDIKGTINYISNSESALYSFFMSGANSLVDRKKLLEIGGFTGIFNPYYWEDVDLGLKAWRMGYKVYYEGKSFCRHPNSATIIKEPGAAVKLISRRNKLYLHYLHLDGVECNYFMLKIFLKTFGRLCIGDLVFAKSTLMFLKSVPALRNIRNEFRKARKEAGVQLSVKNIAAFIKKSIEKRAIEIF